MTISPTIVNSYGTGYYRGTDGTYYYGNPRDGFLAAVAVSSGGGFAVFDLLEFVVTAIGATAMLAVMTFLFLVLSIGALFYALLAVWPQYVGILVNYYSQGIIDLPVILVTAAVALVVIYFLIASVQVLTKKKMRSVRYFLVCTLVIGGLHTLFSLVGGRFGAGELLNNLLQGASLAIFPTILLGFLEHLVTKDLRNDNRWFIVRLADNICPIFPGRSTGVLIFGVIAFLLAFLFLNVSDLGGPLWGSVVMGVIFIFMGIIGKREVSQ